MKDGAGNRGEGGRKGGQQGICGGRHRLRHGGYTVTSHSSQGQTADRVLIHADTELGAKNLLNNRMAYLAVSRGTCDAQFFTNDRESWALGHAPGDSNVGFRPLCDAPAIGGRGLFGPTGRAAEERAA